MIPGGTGACTADGVPPGDPGAVSAAATLLQAVASATGTTAGNVKGISGSLEPSCWVGSGAEGFAAAAGRYATKLGTLQEAYAHLSGGMSVYAAALQAAQALARQANAMAAAAEAEAAAASARVASQSPPAGASPSAVSAFAASQASASAQISNSLSGVLQQADLMRSEAFAQAQAAAATARGVVEAVIGALQPLGASPPSAWSRITDANDKAGWALNSWGVYGAFVTSAKGFQWGSAFLQYLAKSDLAGAANSNGLNLGTTAERSQWSKVMNEAKAAKGSASDARGEFDDSIAPEGGMSAGTILGRTGLGLGMASDVVTFVSPSAPFGPGGVLGGNTDRAMAAANFTASGVALSSSMGATFGIEGGLMAVPGVDVVVGGVIVGTAVYFGGEFVYEHWSDVTHWTSGAADWVGHETSSVASGAWHETSSVASGAWHDATSFVGSLLP